MEPGEKIAPLKYQDRLEEGRFRTDSGDYITKRELDHLVGLSPPPSYYERAKAGVRKGLDFLDKII